MRIGINFYPDFVELPLEVLKEGILNEKNLKFAKQIGADGIVAWMPLPAKNGVWAYEDLLELRKFVEKTGLKVEAVENLPPTHYDRILFGLEGRDSQIENIKTTIRNMGKAGIYCLGYSFSIPGYQGHCSRGENGGGRGDSGIIKFDYDKVDSKDYLNYGELWGGWKTSYYDKSKLLGEVKKEQLWERLIYFLEKILPVAEESDVKMCIHPADPPAPVLRGVENIMNTVEDFKKLIELFPGNYHGLEFCQGTFAEMQNVGPDVIELIHYFGSRKKIFYVHFRNVKGTFPKYEEVFIDEGDVSMIEAMKAYRETGFDGVLIPDHVPVINSVSEPWHTGMAYSIGYMKAVMQALDTI